MPSTARRNPAFTQSARHATSPFCGTACARTAQARSLPAAPPAAISSSERTDQPTIAVDAGGADAGADEVAQGCVLAAQQGVNVLLYADAKAVGDLPSGVHLIDAPLSIAKAPDPARAVRSNPEASIVQAAAAVASGEADALVSGGSTGATLAVGLLKIKRGAGVRRPALALTLAFPGRTKPVLLLDVGATPEAKTEFLVQYAYLGAAFSEAVLGTQRPRVALLSNGSEADRGSDAVVGANEVLAASELEFIGNIEGDQITEGAADVIVTDGFTGNVTLKVMEGISSALMSAVRDRALDSTRGKLGGLLLRPSLRRLRDDVDPERFGGALLLGLRKPVVVCHGRFSRSGFSAATLVAAKAVRENSVERAQAALAAAGALRTVAVDSQANEAVPD